MYIFRKYYQIVASVKCAWFYFMLTITVLRLHSPPRTVAYLPVL